MGFKKTYLSSCVQLTLFMICVAGDCDKGPADALLLGPGKYGVAAKVGLKTEQGESQKMTIVDGYNAGEVQYVGLNLANQAELGNLGDDFNEDDILGWITGLVNGAGVDNCREERREVIFKNKAFDIDKLATVLFVLRKDKAKDQVVLEDYPEEFPIILSHACGCLVRPAFKFNKKGEPTGSLKKHWGILPQRLTHKGDTKRNAGKNLIGFLVAVLPLTKKFYKKEKEFRENGGAGVKKEIYGIINEIGGKLFNRCVFSDSGNEDCAYGELNMGSFQSYEIRGKEDEKSWRISKKDEKERRSGDDESKDELDFASKVFINGLIGIYRNLEQQ